MQQVLKETSSDYQAFISDITDMVKEMMGEEYTVRIFKVTKNNSLELDSLVLLKEGKNFAPNIYLLPYYEAYMEGVSLQELAQRICGIYQSCTAPLTGDNFQYSLEEMKGNIIYRLVNYDKNHKLLETIPHIRYLDLAITFHCLVHNDGEGIGTIRITNEHMEQWNISLKELQAFAIENTRKKFPPILRSMEEVIKRMISEEYGDNVLCAEMQNNLFQDTPDQHKMYILSNKKGINGATCLLYDNVLSDIAEQLRSDFFILPSSIHEVILVPYDKSISKEALMEMVKDVNRTQVASDEILSDRVYIYSSENKAICP
ncbi:MAG TPA: DUF5688 family protein [Mobilitalea sp.]|nr:DUF5688 family protein [Mobilitalea sp.]